MSSPNYGPAGKPSPGRVVRFYLSGKEIPAIIYSVDSSEDGAAEGRVDLIYDLIGETTPGNAAVVARKHSPGVPFAPDGEGEGPRWSWFPKA